MNTESLMMIQNDKVNFIRYLLWQLNFFLQNPRRIITLEEFEVLIFIQFVTRYFQERQFVLSERETIDLGSGIFSVF